MKLREEIRANFRYRSCYPEISQYTRLLEECEKVDVATLEHRGGGFNHLVIMNILPKPGSLQNRELADRYFKQGCEPVQRVIWLPENIYTLYVWLLAYPDLWNLIAPYSTAQFDNGWKALLTNMGFANNIDKMILQIGWAFTQDFAYYELAEGKLGGYHYLPCKCSDCKEYNWYVKRSNDFHYLEFLKDSIVRKLERFLQEYKEGAFVMLALLDAAHHGWRGDIGLPALPGIAGKHPIEVLRLIKKLNDIMRLNSNFEVFLIYFDRARRLNFFKKVIYRPDIYLNQSKDYKDDFLEELRGYGGFDLAAGELGMPYDTRKGVRFLKTTLTDRWDWFSRNYPEAARQWVSTDEIERWYSLNRAWEIVFYSETIAYTDTSLVSALVHLLKDTEARLVEAKQREKDEKLKKEEAEKRKEIERKCAEKMANISIAPLENLAPVVLSESEIKALREACLKELYQTNQRDWDVKTTLEVIDEFVKFCILLMKPENHVKVQSGQYVEKQVNTRQYHDMNDEMAWELMKLPRFTAYAKVIQEQQGEQVIRIRKIKTLKLEEPRLQGRELEEMKKQINENTKILGYIKPRVQIEDEIRQRQEKWRSGALSDQPPPTYY